VRILACFVRGRQSAKAYRALVKYAPLGSLEMIETGRDVSDYWHAIRARWTGDDDLVIIEQDNVITAEVLPSFAECDEPWCCFSYLGPPGLDLDGSGAGRVLMKSLGCTKFSADLQAKITATMISDKEYFVFHLLDMRLSRLLEVHDYQPHVHGAIEHCHKYTTDEQAIFKDRAMRAAGVQAWNLRKDKKAAQ
jgi:hypothetical protein